MRESTGHSKHPVLWTGLSLAAAAAGYFLVVRPRHLTWGCTRQEAKGYLPGDSLLQNGVTVATHAVTIRAPLLDVWAWIAQIGQGRGGFYSYTMLENLVGCQMHNADGIHPEWQDVHQGDMIRFHPKLPPWPIEMLETGDHLVVGTDLHGAEGITWSFVVREVAPETTRLIVRLRAQSHRGVRKLADLLLYEPMHFVMERKMMLNIKHLAERHPTETHGAAA